MDAPADNSPKKTLAIVDDDPATLRMLTRYFGHYGFGVVTAKDGEQAIEVVTATEPDLVILDIMMPKKDGFDVALEIREKYPTLPIIMFTARVDHHDKLRGLMTGAHRYLTKPCSPVKIMDEVTKLLGIAPPPTPMPSDDDLGGLASGDPDATAKL